MKIKLNIWLIIAFIVSLSAVFIFEFYLLDEIKLIYNGKKEGILYQIINLIYPRFGVESQRFNLNFFIDHARQIVFRFVFVLMCICVFIYLKNYYQNLNQKIKSFWSQPYDIQNNIFIYPILFGSIIYYMYDFYKAYDIVWKFTELYEPILIFKILHIKLLPSFIIKILNTILIITCIASMINIFPKFNAIIATIIFIIFQGYSYSFGKINHGYAPLTYILLLSVIQHFTKPENKTIIFNLMKIALVSCYLMAGLEKLLISGFQWVSAETFQAYLNLHPTKIGLWVSEYSVLCFILPFTAIIIQLAFPLILVFKNHVKWFIIAGSLFHWGTVILFDISSFWHPWIICYVIFIDWVSIFKKINTNLGN